MIAPPKTTRVPRPMIASHWTVLTAELELKPPSRVATESPAARATAAETAIRRTGGTAIPRPWPGR